ncbi:MAG TPA: metallophosphoesterase family protein [Candidatus Lokiarchaeia archaeon]|nr:metallophosphoesterase family protein [Candidatus Lokiarchaeia archaeon]
MEPKRWQLIDTLRGQRKSKIVKTLAVNLLLSVSLFVPLLAFLSSRQAERITSTNAKEPWLLWHGDPSSSIVISWETDTPSNSFVSYGLSSLHFVYNDTISSQTTMHHIYLSGLVPDSLYYYRVGSIDAITNQTTLGSTFHFWTAPATTNAAFSFLFISDTQESELGISAHARVAEALAGYDDKDARFLIHGGDLVNDGASQSSWNYYFKHAAIYLPYFPLVCTLGNHDNMGGASYFREYTALNDSAPLYYSFNYSCAHFTVLTVPYGTAAELTAAMLQWLNGDLSRSASMKFRIVIFHCPVLSSGFFGKNQELLDNLHPILVNHNVTLVLNGHSHHYERLLLDGITYVIAGGGGGVMDPCHSTLPQTEAINDVPHFLKIDVNPVVGMRVNAITPDNVTFDSVLLGGGA